MLRRSAWQLLAGLSLWMISSAGLEWQGAVWPSVAAQKDEDFNRGREPLVGASRRFNPDMRAAPAQLAIRKF